MPKADLLQDIAYTYGTPTYVYVESIIQEQIAHLQRVFSPLSHRLLYAVKANSHPAILRIMVRKGLGFDVVSPGELLLLRRMGVTPDCILFSANFMTDEEMHLAHREGVRLNIGELSLLQRFGEAYPGSTVCVRLNPSVGAGHHAYVVTAGEETKFGIPSSRISEVLEIARMYDLHISGIHQHIGSGFLSPEPLVAAAHHLLEAATHFPELDFINLGGGLGIPYRPEEKPFPLEALPSTLFPLLEAFQERYPRRVSFWLEPGRYIVGPAGVLLVRVTGIKETSRHRFAGTDSGMNHLIRPALYKAYHEVVNLSNPEGVRKTYTVTGNICETGDILAYERTIPEIREGDLLAIKDTGAYGMAMASTYNLRPLPAEVLVRSSGEIVLIRPRQSLPEFLDWYFPDR